MDTFVTAFRTIFYKLVPSWLSTGEGEKVLFALGTVKDMVTERLRLGLEARFPTRASKSAQAYIGADRGIVRGRSESNAQYAERLVRWRYPRGHRVRGNALALLEQVWAYFARVPVASIDIRGNKYVRDTDGAETITQGESWDWDGTGASPNWARFWLVLFADNVTIKAHPNYGDPALWGGALGTPGYTIGQQGVSADDVAVMRRFFKGRTWHMLGSRPEWLIVSFNGAMPPPDQYYGNWSRNIAGVQTPTRSASFRYWSLSPELNNTYTGKTTSPATSTYVAGGGTYTPSATYHAGAIAMPGGAAYTPVATYHESVRLPDDGSAV